MIISGTELASHLSLEGSDYDSALVDGKANAAGAWIIAFTGIDPADYASTETDAEGNAVTVYTFPDPLREAALQLAAAWFESREAYVAGEKLYQAPINVADLLTPFRKWSF